MPLYRAVWKAAVTRGRCPQRNRCVFGIRWNSKGVSSESRGWRGRLFQRRRHPANDRSPRLVRPSSWRTARIATLDDRSRQRPVLVVWWVGDHRSDVSRSLIFSFRFAGERGVITSVTLAEMSIRASRRATNSPFRTLDRCRAELLGVLRQRKLNKTVQSGPKMKAAVLRVVNSSIMHLFKEIPLLFQKDVFY